MDHASRKRDVEDPNRNATAVMGERVRGVRSLQDRHGVRDPGGTFPALHRNPHVRQAQEKSHLPRIFTEYADVAITDKRAARAP